MYCIKQTYNPRTNLKYFDDTTNTDRYQDKIYAYGRKIFANNNYNNVLDIGCGSGFKLIKYFHEFDTTGIDVPQTVKFLDKKYPDKKWTSIDIENDNINISEQYDLVLAIDIIEHLSDPDVLLNFINRLSFNTCIISTPERDIVRGINDNGPPINVCHVREWNKEEFNNYISTMFNVVDRLIVNKHEQFVVCKKIE